MKTFDEYAELFDRTDARFKEVLSQYNAAQTGQGRDHYLRLMARLNRIMESHLAKMRELAYGRVPDVLKDTNNINLN